MKWNLTEHVSLLYRGLRFLGGTVRCLFEWRNAEILVVLVAGVRATAFLVWINGLMAYPCYILVFFISPDDVLF